MGKLTATHTYAELGLSKAAYEEIATKLRDAGYSHAFMDDGAIDMHGIGVTLEHVPDSQSPPAAVGKLTERTTEKIARALAKASYEGMHVGRTVSPNQSAAYVENNWRQWIDTAATLTPQDGRDAEIKRLREALQYVISEGDHVARWVLADRAKRALAAPPLPRAERSTE